jgi:multiple sugar transport system substrate-binding protein
MDPNLPQQPQSPQAAPSPVDPYYGNEGNTLLKKILIIAGIVVGLIIVIIIIWFAISRINASKTSQNVTLTYWGVWEDSKVMEPVIEDFERQHPNIKVQYQLQDIKGLGDYVDRLTTRITQGDGPDIVRFHNSWTLELKNYLLPFPKDFVSATKLDSDYYKTVQRDMQINGVYYGIPQGVDTLALFVNTDLLNNVGLKPTDNFDDIASESAGLTVKDGGEIVTSGLAAGTYGNVAHASDIVSMILMMGGVDMKDMTGPTNNIAVQAFQVYTGFADPTNGVWNGTLDNSQLAFAKGNLAMFYGYSWDIPIIKGINPNLKFQVIEVPTKPHNKVTVSSYWAEGVSLKSKHPKEALEFLEYLSQPSTLQKLYKLESEERSFGELYPRRSMASLLSSNALLMPFVAQADDAQATIFASDTYDGKDGMITQLDRYMENAINSINNNNTSAGSAVETLAKGVAQVLSRYGG